MSKQNVWDILNCNLFFVKDVVARHEAKTSDKLDVYDPESRKIVLECREPGIGLLTKMARFCGGDHDEGTSFNLVASIPGTREQVLRIARRNATFSFGGPAVKILDHGDSLLGKLKMEIFALGMKFAFVPEKQGEPLILHIKGHEIFFDDKNVAAFSRMNSDFFKENKFDYAFSISEEIPPHSPIRQVLLAFALARHRIIIKTTILIPT